MYCSDLLYSDRRIFGWVLVVSVMNIFEMPIFHNISLKINNSNKVLKSQFESWTIHQSEQRKSFKRGKQESTLFQNIHQQVRLITFSIGGGGGIFYPPPWEKFPPWNFCTKFGQLYVKTVSSLKLKDGKCVSKILIWIYRVKKWRRRQIIFFIHS